MENGQHMAAYTKKQFGSTPESHLDTKRAAHRLAPVVISSPATDSLIGGKTNLGVLQGAVRPTNRRPI